MRITIRVGARAVKNRQELLDWLSDNVGPALIKESTPRGFDFTGTGWAASWKVYGAGWFMDVNLSSTDAALFKLRWGGRSINE